MESNQGTDEQLFSSMAEDQPRIAPQLEFGSTILWDSFCCEKYLTITLLRSSIYSCRLDNPMGYSKRAQKVPAFENSSVKLNLAAKLVRAWKPSIRRVRASEQKTRKMR